MHSNKKYKSMFGQPGINLCPINYIQLVPNPRGRISSVEGRMRGSWNNFVILWLKEMQLFKLFTNRISIY